MTALAQSANSTVQSIPDIIKQASTSPLGIFALMIIVIGLLAFYFFRKAPTNTKVAIFLVLFLGVVLYGVAITRASQPVQPSPDRVESLALEGVVTDSATGNGISGAEITASGAAAPEVSDSTGKFHIIVKVPATGNTVKLRVTKRGYDTLLWDVTPPVPIGFTVQLSRSKYRQ